MSPLAYRSLTPRQERIRLVEILPSDQKLFAQNMTHVHGVGRLPDTSDNLVICRLSHASLGDLPRYTALSYSWGDASVVVPIIIDGSIVSVTKNLEAALRHLRLQDRVATFWIDALCIDQGNDIEKSEQLEYMRPIYSQAVSVVAWLGPSEDDSGLAMRWIDTFGTRAHEFGIGTTPDLTLGSILDSLAYGERKGSIASELENFVNDLRHELLGSNQQTFALLRALDHLFKRSYWSRVWVVQELASAANTIFACGTSTVSENALHYALRLVRNYRHYQVVTESKAARIRLVQEMSITSLNPQSPITLLKFRRSARSAPLIYLLRSLRHFQSTDPRDKLFALYGIASDIKSLELHSDYSKTWQEIYIAVAQTLILHGYVEILSLCEFRKGISSLPSWVSDWSVDFSRSPLQQRALDRSGLRPVTRLQPAFSASHGLGTGEVNNDETSANGSLLLTGILFGRIEILGRAWKSGQVSEWLTDLRDLQQEVCGTRALNTSQNMAIWRTAVADQEIWHGIHKPRLSKAELCTVDSILETEPLCHLDAGKLIDVGLGDYCKQLCDVAQGRRPISISGKYLGIGPNESEVDDLVFIPCGSGVPYILRRVELTNELQLVGEAYIHGIMDGEALYEGVTLETVTIK